MSSTKDSSDLLESIRPVRTSYRASSSPPIIMIKYVVVFAALCFVIANARPADELLERKSSNDGDGGYSSSYKTSGGTKVSEEGYKKKTKDGKEVYAKRGSYQYKNGGKIYKTTYTADENGYQAKNQILDDDAGELRKRAAIIHDLEELIASEILRRQ